ncbi:MAG: hypothetical protein RBT75_06390 [Anaerolineae bacterium]|jgi:hypothetical protein|nr:hypothetical protein [Anaerolineae bacterium]
MFGKKRPECPPYVLQVLTPESLIEGTVEGYSTLYLAGEAASIPPLLLTSVRIQTTGAADIPAQTCAQLLVFGINAVALIPRVEFTQMAEHEVWTLYMKPFPGVLHVGPYVIQGKMNLRAENHFEKQIPIFDVRIASRIPGSRLRELFAPFALINFHWLRGWEPQ